MIFFHEKWKVMEKLVNSFFAASFYWLWVEFFRFWISGIERKMSVVRERDEGSNRGLISSVFYWKNVSEVLGCIQSKHFLYIQGFWLLFSLILNLIFGVYSPESVSLLRIHSISHHKFTTYFQTVPKAESRVQFIIRFKSILI